MTRVLTFLLLSLMATAAFGAGYRVVANATVPATRLTRAQASDLFMKRTVKWSDGTPAVVIDQVRSSPVRATFSEEVHKKAVTAVVSHWNQQIFRGRAVPPVEVKSDADVLAAVRSTPGAIGYISTTAATDDVKIIEID